MTEKNLGVNQDALDDFDTDLQSLWDETDDNGVTLPGSKPVEGDDEDDGETTDEDEGETLDGESEESSDADEGDDPDDDSDDSEDESQGEEDEDEGESVDYKSQWEKAQLEIKTMAGRLRAAEQRAQQPAQTQKPSPVAENNPITDEEDAFLTQFTDKYNEDVVKAINIIATRRASQLVESTIQSRLTPIEAQTQEMITQAHFAAIESVHPDIDKIDASPVFESWIQSRPEHLRDTYVMIRERGTPAQVIAMVNEFKKDTGASKTTQKTTRPKESKVAAATAVSRRRGTVGTSPAKASSDLQALWDEIED